MTNVEALLCQAQACERLGRLNEADRLYSDLLQQIPDCVEVHFLLGCVRIRDGRPADAVAPLVEVTSRMPLFADAHIVLGNTYVSLGRWDPAADALSRAVELRPDLLPVQINLALALFSAGRTAESEALYNRIVTEYPESHDAHSNLAHILNEQGRFEEAERHARKAVELAPGNGAAINILSLALHGLGRLEEARAFNLRALTIDPSLPRTDMSLYDALREQSRFGELELVARRALELNPNYGPALDALGLALADRGEFDEALGYIDRAIAEHPDSGGITQHLASTYSRMGRLEEAVAIGLKAVKLDPTPVSKVSLAHDQLRTGRYLEGWRSIQGLGVRATALTERFGMPKWEGGPLRGRKLLTFPEGGLGDTFQFARFLPMVSQRAGGKVLFECLPGAMDLLRDVPGVSKLIPRTTIYVPPTEPVDCFLSLLDAPALFRMTEETIPPARLPLRVPEARRAEWKRRISAISGIKVGLSWAGNAEYREDRNRSMQLENFAPIADLQGVTFVSLQVGPPADEIETSRHGLDILHLPDEISSLTNTAAAICELDIVISVDTAIAHLAGALGVETWLLLPFVSHWVWNAYRPDDTPWYPTHRLFRQPWLNDWESVIARIAEELATRIDGRAGKIGDDDKH